MVSFWLTTNGLKVFIVVHILAFYNEMCVFYNALRSNKMKQEYIFSVVWGNKKKILVYLNEIKVIS